VEAWNTYMDALGKAGELEAMEQALSEMKQQGVQPDVYTFSAMLNGYASHKRPEQMEETAELMEKAGIEMDTVSYSTLTKGKSRAGRTDKVKEIFFRYNGQEDWEV